MCNNFCFLISLVIANFQINVFVSYKMQIEWEHAGRVLCSLSHSQVGQHKTIPDPLQFDKNKPPLKESEC